MQINLQNIRWVFCMSCKNGETRWKIVLARYNVANNIHTVPFGIVVALTKVIVRERKFREHFCGITITTKLELVRIFFLRKSYWIGYFVVLSILKLVYFTSTKSTFVSTSMIGWVSIICGIGRWSVLCVIHISKWCICWHFRSHVAMHSKKTEHTYR